MKKLMEVEKMCEGVWNGKDEGWDERYEKMNDEVNGFVWNDGVMNEELGMVMEEMGIDVWMGVC